MVKHLSTNTIIPSGNIKNKEEDNPKEKAKSNNDEFIDTLIRKEERDEKAKIRKEDRDEREKILEEKNKILLRFKELELKIRYKLFSSASVLTSASSTPNIVGDFIKKTGDTATGNYFFLDDSGIVVGHSSKIDFGAIPEFQVLGTATPDSSMGFARFSNDTGGPDVRFLKSRGTTVGANTIVQNNDTLGRIRFQGSDGIDFNTTAAEILGQVDGAPSGNDIPGRIVFKTRLDGGVLAERMTIKNDGNVGIGTDTPLSKLHLSSTNPTQIFEDSNAGTDKKIWEFTNLNGQFTIQTKTDANGTGESGLIMTRDGTTVTLVRVPFLQTNTLAPSPPDSNTLYKDNICKGWIKFNGTGTITINDSFNVSSITDSGVGIYDINWDRDFANSNYMCSEGHEVNSSNVNDMVSLTIFAVGSMRLIYFSNNATADNNILCAVAFGDQ